MTELMFRRVFVKSMMDLGDAGEVGVVDSIVRPTVTAVWGSHLD